jgi:hypothetical protein
MSDQCVLGARPRATEHEAARGRKPAGRNGAKSRGPKTARGKARSAQNALKHGLRAHRFVLLADEDTAAFQALEAALHAELAPEGALQTMLVARLAVTTWRMLRADRMEIELLDRACRPRRAGAAGAPWPRADPGWPRSASDQHAAALSRRGPGRVLAPAPRALRLQGRGSGSDRAPGRRHPSLTSSKERIRQARISSEPPLSKRTRAETQSQRTRATPKAPRPGMPRS